eukprot:1160954-Pelagomonas_calceolata.AAC.4
MAGISYCQNDLLLTLGQRLCMPMHCTPSKMHDLEANSVPCAALAARSKLQSKRENPPFVHCPLWHTLATAIAAFHCVHAHFPATPPGQQAHILLHH